MSRFESTVRNPRHTDPIGTAVVIEVRGDSDHLACDGREAMLGVVWDRTDAYDNVAAVMDFLGLHRVEASRQRREGSPYAATKWVRDCLHIDKGSPQRIIPVEGLPGMGHLEIVAPSIGDQWGLGLVAATHRAMVQRSGGSVAISVPLSTLGGKTLIAAMMHELRLVRVNVCGNDVEFVPWSPN